MKLANTETQSTSTAHDYVGSLVADVEFLLEESLRYRNLASTAKTPLAKSMYEKKLRKYVAKLDPRMTLLSKISNSAQTPPPEADTSVDATTGLTATQLNDMAKEIQSKTKRGTGAIYHEREG